MAICKHVRFSAFVAAIKSTQPSSSTLSLIAVRTPQSKLDPGAGMKNVLAFGEFDSTYSYDS